jgi:hypothetical protein
MQGMVGVHQVMWLVMLESMWLVMLESVKDRILGVDTLGQHVPPRVRYGTAC